MKLSPARQIWLTAHKRFLIISLVTLIAILVVILRPVLFPATSPVPANIKSQLSFPVLYPKNDTVNSSSWKYLSDEKDLTFTVKHGDFTVVFTEQEVPLAYQNDQAAYDRFIGTLRPSATFNTPLGSVSLASFVTAGDFQYEGKSAILKSHNTLLIAHPSRALSDDEWRSLFDSLKVDS